MPFICSDGRTICDNSSPKALSNSIVIKENTYLAKVVDPSNTAEYDACLRLRHDYFVKKRHWVTSPHPDKEYDHYDPYCTHLAVFGANTDIGNTTPEVLAYLRLLPWTQHINGFMLENEFVELLPDADRTIIDRLHSCEISRLVVSPIGVKCLTSRVQLSVRSDIDNTQSNIKSSANIRPQVGSNDEVESQGIVQNATLEIVEVLLKLLYYVALDRGITHFYAVTEPALLRILRRRFNIPFERLGQQLRMGDGTTTIGGVAILETIETAVAQRDPGKYAWYRDETEDLGEGGSMLWQPLPAMGLAKAKILG